MATMSWWHMKPTEEIDTITYPVREEYLYMYDGEAELGDELIVIAI